MKAIRVHQFGAADVMRCEDIQTPAPAKDGVLIQVEAAGVNPVDTYIRTGTYAVKPELPYTPGIDVAGVVSAVGDDVTRFAKGDRVYAAGTVTGGHAAMASCREVQVYPLPDNVSSEQGAALGVPAATAYRALFQRGKAQAGERVLIHGATGSVGLAAVQMAQAAGLTVYATGGSEAGRQTLADMKVAGVFDHYAAGYTEAIQQASGGVDLVLEMLGNVNLAADLQLIDQQGRIVVIGNRGAIEINPRAIMQKEAIVTGVMLFAATPEEQVEIHNGLYRYLQQGDLTPVIGQRFSLAEAAKAHEAVLASHVGKIVLVPGGEE